MNDKSSENRAPWPLYSQSFYYSFVLDNKDVPAYHFLFKTLTKINKKDMLENHLYQEQMNNKSLRIERPWSSILRAFIIHLFLLLGKFEIGRAHV